MNTTHELIRQNLLSQLEVAYPIALPMQTLQQGLMLAGLNLQAHQLEKELEYLHDKGFLAQTFSELCPYNKRYKLSTNGIDFLENENRHNTGF